MAARPAPEDFEDYVAPTALVPAVLAAAGGGLSAEDMLDAALEANLPADPLLRKMRRAALRKQRVMEIEESEDSEDPKPRKRSRSRRRRRRGTDSEEEAVRENARMMAALRPAGMVHQGVGRGAMDVVTGGYGGIAPPPGEAQMGGIVGLAQQSSLATRRDGGKICMKFLMNICMNGDACEQRHPTDPFDVNRWIQYFNKLDCKYGDACPADRCIYNHPNRPGYSGGPMILTGTSL